MPEHIVRLAILAEPPMGVRVMLVGNHTKGWGHDGFIWRVMFRGGKSHANVKRAFLSPLLSLIRFVELQRLA